MIKIDKSYIKVGNTVLLNQQFGNQVSVKIIEMLDGLELSLVRFPLGSKLVVDNNNLEEKIEKRVDYEF